MKYTEKQARVLFYISEGRKIKHIKTNNKDYRNLILFEDGARIYFYEYEQQELEEIYNEMEILAEAYDIIKDIKTDSVEYYKNNRLRYR